MSETGRNNDRGKGEVCQREDRQHSLRFGQTQMLNLLIKAFHHEIPFCQVSWLDLSRVILSDMLFLSQNNGDLMSEVKAGAYDETDS